MPGWVNGKVMQLSAQKQDLSHKAHHNWPGYVHKVQWRLLQLRDWSLSSPSIPHLTFIDMAEGDPKCITYCTQLLNHYFPSSLWPPQYCSLSMKWQQFLPNTDSLTQYSIVHYNKCQFQQAMTSANITLPSPVLVLLLFAFRIHLRLAFAAKSARFFNVTILLRGQLLALKLCQSRMQCEFPILTGL